MDGRVVVVVLSAAGCEFIGLFRGGRSKAAPPYTDYTNMSELQAVAAHIYAYT